jgi:hypothetical protein
MNSKDFIQALRKVIREEVSTAVRTELKHYGSVINETKRSVRQEPTPTYTNAYKPKPKPKQQFTQNSMLNDILNDTGGFRAENPYAALNENVVDYSGDFDDWPSMQMGARPSLGMSRAAAIPTVDPEGRPINPANVPEEVVNAITKDYSALMKAINKKKGL